MCLVIIGGSVVAVMLSMYIVKATANDDTILDLRNLELAYTSIIYYRNINENGEEEWPEYQRLDSPIENRIWKNIDGISKNLQNAFVAIEDDTFWTHSGFNPKRTVYAALNELAKALTGSYLRDNKQGASTINQQLIKNITDEDADTGTAGYLRKAREIFRSMALTNRYSKQEILEAYLNTISLTGNIGGVEAGANRYFDKHAGDQENIDAGKEPLTIAECASIAAITKNPTMYDPMQNPEEHLRRRNDVIWYMLEQGYITKAEADVAYDAPLTMREKTVADDAAKQSLNSWFTDFLIKDVTRGYAEQNGIDEQEALALMYNDGWKIYATVVPSLQDNIEKTFAEANPKIFPAYTIPDFVPLNSRDEVILNADGTEPEPKEIRTNAASAAINYKGELCAVAGSLFPKTQDRVLNVATDSVRQVGSTMKGIASYPLAIENNYAHYSRTILDSPLQNEVRGDDGKIKEGWPKNFNDRWSNRYMTVWEAFSDSINTVAVKLGNVVGKREMLDFCRDTLEITSLVDGDAELAPIVLGSMTHGISPYELAGAYMMNGNGGEFYSLHSYVAVEDRNGEVILRPDINRVQAISPDTSYIMNRLMRAVVQRGSANGFGISEIAGMETVGKTGTTDFQKDIWFVGMNPYYVMATWFGYNEAAKMPKYTHSAHPGVYAYKDVMTNELANEAKYPVKTFPVPDEDSVIKASFCIDSGGLASGGCRTAVGYYKKDAMPGYCGGHVAAAPPA